jgi:hypothetical protein
MRLAPVPKFVLFLLADAARDPDDLEAPRACWPSIPKLVEWTGLARSTVLDHLKDLEAAAHIGSGEIARARDRLPGVGTGPGAGRVYGNPSGCRADQSGRRTGTGPAGGPRIPI